MTAREKFTVITNKELIEKQTEVQTQTLHTNPLVGGSANPYYEKLMQFNANQKQKKFTVEDLLNW